MSDRDRADPSSLTPREAVDRYLRRRSSDSAEASVYNWWYRLKLWIAWCEDIGIDRVGEVSGYDLDEYYERRSAAVAPATLEGEMWTLTKFFEYLEQLEAVDSASLSGFGSLTLTTTTERITRSWSPRTRSLSSGTSETILPSTKLGNTSS